MRQTITRRTFLTAAVLPPLLAQAAASQTTDNNVETVMPQTIRFSFDDQTFTATLYDNAVAQDFLSMLPLDLKIEDYSTNEKISYLPSKLTEAGAASFGNEAPGDLCYFAPWGNLAMFYGSYSYSSGLLRLGRFDGGPAPLLTKGQFALRIELAD